MTGQNKGSGEVEEMAISSFSAATLPSYIPFSFSALSRICLVCIWKLIFTCCLGEDETMRLYNEESSWDRHRKERGRSLREVQPVENLQACQFQLVHSGLWTVLFLRPLRERPMFSHSALQLELFPLCSWPFTVSLWANQPSKLWIFGNTLLQLPGLRAKLARRMAKEITGRFTYNGSSAQN